MKVNCSKIVIAAILSKVQAGAAVRSGAFFLVGASSNVRVQGVTRQVGAFDGLKNSI